MKTQTEVRKSFWASFPEFAADYRKTYRQNQYNVDIRCSFVGYVDTLLKSNQITEKLANRVTL
jgi:hypothetical protein